MADPLSVAASVVGLITPAAQISKLLQGLRHAPDSVRRLKSEVDGTSGALVQLQQYILRKVSASISRTSLILVEKVQVVLGSCVLTFSELDVLAESFANDSSLGLMDRFRWLSISSTIDELLAKTQEHKMSLLLMLTTLSACVGHCPLYHSVHRRAWHAQNTLRSASTVTPATLTSSGASTLRSFI